MVETDDQKSWLRPGWAVIYFFALLAWLFATLEGEVAHWFTLVLVPSAGIWWLNRRAGTAIRMTEVLRRLGLHWPEKGRGVRLALALAVAVQILQMMNGPQREELGQILSSVGALWVVPGALVLTFATAAFTEEFFFRGVLQRSLTAQLKSSSAAVVLTSFAFALYHLPYAYGNPTWPSAGDFLHASRLALINGVLGGAILGAVFIRARGSLLPGMLLHAAVNWIPAIRLLAQASQKT